jgi:hypothetical protein
MRIVALLLVATATASVLRLRVPLDQLVVRSPSHWIALNGTQQLPFEACFETSFHGNWSAAEPTAIEISLPCNALSSNTYLRSFAYMYSYFFPEDHIHPTVLLTKVGTFQHAIDVRVPRTMLTERDIFCLEMEGPMQMTCDLSMLDFRVY